MAINNYKEDEKNEEVIKIYTVKRLFAYMLSYKKEVLTILLFMLTIISISVVNPLIMQVALDDFVPNKNVKGLIYTVIIIVVINIIAMLLTKLRIRMMNAVTNKILVEIRQELYEHIQKLSFGFFDNRPVGKILARVIGDVNSLKNLLSNSVITLIPDFLTVIIVLTIMIIKSPKLAFSAVVLFPFLIFGVAMIEIRAHKLWQVFRKKNSNLNAYTHEVFSGVRVVQGFNAIDQTNEEFDEIVTEHRKSFMDAIRLNDMFWPMVELSWGVGTASVFFIGISMLDKSEITVGLLVLFISYISMFWQPIMNLSNLYNQLITNIAGAERIFEILDIEPDIKDRAEATMMPEIEGNVSFKDVTFSYDNKVNVLNNISFDVKKGEVIAIVGPTGSGKTTIVNLMSRFYDINSGEIRIDGVDISKVNLESLRSQMGIMTQDTFLFTGTIKDNIRYGKLDATDEEIIEAAKAVHAHEFIMELKDGYDSKVNERGSKLSVGQRQLIAYARTMLSQPNILILDEATSSIDTTTERLVQKGIEEIIKGRTSFVIAHRLSTIQKADRILVINHGQIIEEGNHDHLLNQQGFYHSLYMAQF